MKAVIGVIGCGNISRFHFSGLEKAGARVKRVCDIVENNARPYADKFSAEYSADWRDVIADTEVNTVIITTLSSSHKDICMEAIRAGKAVICEKTLTENPDDSLEVISAAEKQGLVLYTSYMKRFIPAVAKAKELLPSLGRILSSHVRSHQRWGNLWDENPESGFFHTPPGGMSQVRKNYGGGILTCGGSHLLDLVLFLHGRPRRVYGKIMTPAGRDYDLRTNALIETTDGIVNFEVLTHPLRHSGFLKDGWDERIEIIGVDGRLEVFSAAWDNPLNKVSFLTHYDNAGGKLTEHNFDAISPFDKAIAFFLGNIEKGKQGIQSIATGYEVDELIRHIQLSSESGRAVDIVYRHYGE